MDGDLGESFQVGAEIPNRGYVFSNATASSFIGQKMGIFFITNTTSLCYFFFRRYWR